MAMACGYKNTVRMEDAEASTYNLHLQVLNNLLCARVVASEWNIIVQSTGE